MLDKIKEERKKGRKEERKKGRKEERKKGRKEERKKGRKEERKKGRKEERKKGRKEERKKGRKEERKKGRKEERKKGRKEERKKGRKEERKKGRKEERKKGRKEERKKGRKEERKKGRKEERKSKSMDQKINYSKMNGDGLLALNKNELHIALQEKFLNYHKILAEKRIDVLYNKSWQQYHAGFIRRASLKRHRQESENSEIIDISLNEFSSVLRSLHTLITKDPPYIDAKAMNSGYNAMAEVVPAKSILEYYQTVGGLDEQIEKAKLWELLFGSAYVLVEWSNAKGQLIAESDGEKRFSGDLEFRAFMPLDVARPFHEPTSGGWRITRELVQQSSIQESYNKNCTQFLTQDYLSETLESNAFYGSQSELEELIDLYTFYHPPTEKHPDGLKAVFTKEHLFSVENLGSEELPLVELMHERIGNTCLGNSVAFDLLEPQKARDALISTAITNEANFGINAVVVPKSAQIEVSKLGKSAKVFEVNSAEDMPQSLNLLGTSGEIFRMEQTLNMSMEKISGINAVVRGEAKASQSGQALALMTSMAVQSASGYMRSFRRAYKQAGEKILALLRTNLDLPRQYRIQGRQGYLVEGRVSGKQLAESYNVQVELVSPLKTTVQGRQMLADSMLDRGLIKNPREYIDVLIHGRIEGIVDEKAKLEEGLRAERSRLISDAKMEVLELQDHAVYIQSAQKLLDDPEITSRPNVVNRVYHLIAQRMETWKQVSLESPSTMVILGFNLHPEVTFQPPEKPPKSKSKKQG